MGLGFHISGNLHLLFCFMKEFFSFIRVRVYFENVWGLGWECVPLGGFFHARIHCACVLIVSWMFITSNFVLDSKFKVLVCFIG